MIFCSEESGCKLTPHSFYEKVVTDKFNYKDHEHYLH